MASRRFVKGAGDYLRTFSSEDNKHYRVESQDFAPAIKHVEHIRAMHETSTKASNPNEWRHVGSVPITLVVDWCNRNGYTFDQFARDEDNCKKKFLKYFQSREFSKLHNSHVTTKKGSSQIMVPDNYIGARPRVEQLRRTEGGDSELA
jgi:hypothetical protein